MLHNLAQRQPLIFASPKPAPTGERTYIIAGEFFMLDNDNFYQVHQRSYTWALDSRVLMALDFAKAEL